MGRTDEVGSVQQEATAGSFRWFQEAKGLVSHTAGLWYWLKEAAVLIAATILWE